MKHKLFTLLFALMASLGTMFAQSGTCGDNLTWNLTDGVLTISGTGAMADYSNLMNVPWYEYRDNISSVKIAYGVTSIGRNAFHLCTNLSSVEISNSLAIIGGSAFGSCSNLTSIEIPNSVTTIIEAAFSHCNGLTSIEIPSSVTRLDEGAFDFCSNLISIVVAEDNNNYFSKDGVLFNKEVTTIIICPNGKQGTYIIPNSVTDIGKRAFSQCSVLTSIEIPSSVTTIGISAFYDCTSLTSIIIPNSVTSIGNYAFYNCTGLTSVTSKAATPPTCGNNVFFNVNKSIPLFIPAQSLEAYKAADVWKDFGNILPIEETKDYLTIAEAIEIGMALDSMATSEDTYTIEGYVFNASSFYESSKNQSWFMADEKYATSSNFEAYRCYPIYEGDTVAVTNGSRVRMTGKLQKYYNRSTASYLVEMTYVPATILSLPQIDTITVAQALEIGSALESLAVTDEEYVIKGYVSYIVNPYDEQYKNETFWITDVKGTRTNDKTQAFEVYRGKPNTQKEIGLDAYIQIKCKIKNYKGIIENDAVNQSFEVLEQGMGIKDDTISPCLTASGTCGENLTWTLTCDSVLTISGTGEMTDYEWSSAEQSPTNPWNSYREIIKFISLPDGLTSIGEYAFRDCSGLTSVTIPNSVTSIESLAFLGCTGLTSVTIGNSVTSIGEYAFRDCSGLTSITIPNSVTSIGDFAFAYCSSLTSVTIPNSVTSIGSYAFNGCSSLISIDIPNSVISIGDGVLARCNNLTSINVNAINANYSSLDGVLFNKDMTALIQYPGGKQGAYTIPNGVTVIRSSAFCGCSDLISVTIPNSVTIIRGQAFQYCSSLTSVEIPNSVTIIGNGAFRYCYGLTSFTNYANTPQAINTNVFTNVNLSACTLYVPAQSLEAYKAADVWKEFGSILPIDEPVETEEANFNVIYKGDGEKQIYSESITLHLPVAPTIEGFTFLKWQVVAGNLEDAIFIQAVYKPIGDDTALPDEVFVPGRKTQKLIRNGNVYILHDNKAYTLTGQIVK